MFFKDLKKRCYLLFLEFSCFSNQIYIHCRAELLFQTCFSLWRMFFFICVSFSYGALQREGRWDAIRWPLSYLYLWAGWKCTGMNNEVIHFSLKGIVHQKILILHLPSLQHTNEWPSSAEHKEDTTETFLQISSIVFHRIIYRFWVA